MPTLKIGPNAVVAKTSVPFSSLFDAETCSIVYECDGAFKSWTPGAELNAITGTVIGRGYLITMKLEVDVSEDFGDYADGFGDAIIAFPGYTNFVSYVNKSAIAFTVLKKDIDGNTLATLPLAANGVVSAFLKQGENLTLASNAVLSAQLHKTETLISAADALTFTDNAVVGTIGQVYTIIPAMDINKVHNVIIKT
jgi:hypothetical protein